MGKQIKKSRNGELLSVAINKETHDVHEILLGKFPSIFYCLAVTVASGISVKTLNTHGKW